MAGTLDIRQKRAVTFIFCVDGVSLTHPPYFTAFDSLIEPPKAKVRDLEAGQVMLTRKTDGRPVRVPLQNGGQLSLLERSRKCRKGARKHSPAFKANVALEELKG